MNRMIVTSVGLLLGCINGVNANAADDLDSTIDELAGDLAALQRDVEAAAPSYEASGKIESVRLTQDNVALYKGADAQSGVVTKLPAGDTLKVIDKVGPWYAVSLDKPMAGYTSGWVSAATVVPESIVAARPDAIEKALRRAQKLKEKYDNNPYVEITGFSIDVFPPNLSVDFAFKSGAPTPTAEP